ncbi:hypothetical protein RYZ26_04995 [Terasakiella sp. A23]|uniref:hypothetical protein n=1 Tax=Terasakiella sp. FCG-A23 TaxID=3080561 RepID=UPI0029542332|nr:hypothetical protein [Terasakiella sp. A23]MDV7338936.1 hypothetical protein [Terasakiella sp. A23]
MPTAEEIEKTFEQARDALEDLDEALFDERLDIKHASTLENRTDVQKKRLKEISEQRKLLSEAKSDLSLKTFRAFDNVSNLPGLIEELEENSKQIKKDLAGLTEKVEYAEKIAKVLKGIAKAVSAVTSLVT